MTQNSQSRRRFLRGASLTAAALAVSGCLRFADEDTTTTANDRAAATATPTSLRATSEATPSSTGSESTPTSTTTPAPTTAATTATTLPDVLTSGGSSTVYPIVNKAASYWNANPEAGDAEYWPVEEYDYDTDERLADYWAGQSGLPAGDGSDPPFAVTVGRSHSGEGLEKLQAGELDIGNSSAPVKRELPDRSDSEYEKFVDHVIAVDGLAVVISAEMYNAGVTQLSGDDLRAVYRGEITNWAGIGGPDRRIQTLGGLEGAGIRTAFVANVFGDPSADTSVDQRYERVDAVVEAVSNADNAIGYVPFPLTDSDGVRGVALKWKGTSYDYPADAGKQGYPLSRDLHTYTYEGTSLVETAFLRLLLSDFGQDRFVDATGYAPLPTGRLRVQRSKLPRPE